MVCHAHAHAQPCPIGIGIIQPCMVIIDGIDPIPVLGPALVYGEPFSHLILIY